LNDSKKAPTSAAGASVAVADREAASDVGEGLHAPSNAAVTAADRSRRSGREAARDGLDIGMDTPGQWETPQSMHASGTITRAEGLPPWLLRQGDRDVRGALGHLHHVLERGQLAIRVAAEPGVQAEVSGQSERRHQYRR